MRLLIITENMQQDFHKIGHYPNVRGQRKGCKKHSILCKVKIPQECGESNGMQETAKAQALQLSPSPRLQTPGLPLCRTTVVKPTLSLPARGFQLRTSSKAGKQWASSQAFHHACTGWVQRKNNMLESKLWQRKGYIVLLMQSLFGF